jgi:hypothetical protein
MKLDRDYDRALPEALAARHKRAALSPHLASEEAPVVEDSKGARWFYAYLALQIVCQLALLVPVLAPFRLIFRISAFGSSLAILLLAPGRASTSSFQRSVLIACLVVVAGSRVKPHTAHVLASFAHFSFYLAIASPVFWGSRLAVSPKALEKILLVLWAFSTASAFAGVLQVIFPGRFQPPLSAVLAERGPDFVAAMSIRLASGEWVLRPMGLTDVPGGAASGGLYAALLGVGVILARPFTGARWLGLVAVTAGMTCLYLSQVRSLVVTVGICLITVVAVLAVAGRLGRMVSVLLIGAVLAVIAFSVALSLGGSSVTDRLATLTRESPTAVYYKNRGIFLEHTFAELLLEYPLGAGLGRWGMMSAYFGDRARALWVEIQWTGWLFDGGILLLVLYPVAVLDALFRAVRIARAESRSDLGIWAALVAAYDVGTIALLFNYPVFMSSGGLEFWLLNTALVRAAVWARSHAEEGARELVPA